MWSLSSLLSHYGISNKVFSNEVCCNMLSQARRGPTDTSTHTQTSASLVHKHTPCGRGGLASASSYHISPHFLVLSVLELSTSLLSHGALISSHLRYSGSPLPGVKTPSKALTAEVSGSTPPVWKTPPSFSFLRPSCLLFVRSAMRTSCQVVC